MYASTSTGPWVWLHIHWVFLGLALFGFIAALIWLYKHANKRDFLNIVLVSIILGILGGLLTAPAASIGWYQMMGSHHAYGWGEGLEGYESDSDFHMGDMMEEMLEEFEE